MKFTKQNWYIIISSLMGSVWVVLPEINCKNVTCYDYLPRRIMDCNVFNKVQYYYFLMGTFVVLILKKRLAFWQYLILELFVIIPVLIKLYVYLCAQ